MVAAEDIRRTDAPVIFLAHREELLSQAQRTIESHCDVECEYELASQAPARCIQLPVLLTSSRPCVGRQWKQAFNKFSPYNYGLLVVETKATIRRRRATRPCSITSRPIKT